MTSELGTNSRGPRTDEISRVAKLLMETWYRVDPSSTVTKEPASYVANFADMAKTMIADWNTRAVPDVPELVRYNHTYGMSMILTEEGEYVRYDQAAEIIAAEKQAAINARNLLQYEKDQQWQERAEAAEAKLAQYLQK